MGFAPASMGLRLLEDTFKVGPSTGLLPFRVVILDNVATPNYGTQWKAPIKYPNTTFANGERVIGVTTGPYALAATASDGLAPATAWAAFTPVAQNRSMNVRLHGVVPILCDDTTDGTNINAGTQVKASVSTTVTISSQTVTMAGTIAAVTLSTNAPASQSHVIGVSFTRVAPSADSSQYALVHLRPQEA